MSCGFFTIHHIKVELHHLIYSACFKSSLSLTYSKEYIEFQDNKNNGVSRFSKKILFQFPFSQSGVVIFTQSDGLVYS